VDLRLDMLGDLCSCSESFAGGWQDGQTAAVEQQRESKMDRQLMNQQLWNSNNYWHAAVRSCSFIPDACHTPALLLLAS
jgi:hypothetical protein